MKLVVGVLPFVDELFHNRGVMIRTNGALLLILLKDGFMKGVFIQSLLHFIKETAFTLKVPS